MLRAWGYSLAMSMVRMIFVLLLLVVLLGYTILMSRYSRGMRLVETRCLLVTDLRGSITLIRPRSMIYVTFLLIRLVWALFFMLCLIMVILISRRRRRAVQSLIRIIRCIGLCGLIVRLRLRFLLSQFLARSLDDTISGTIPS